MQSLLSIILFVGGAQGSLLSLALFTVRRGNRKANLILAVLLLIFSFLILAHAIGHYYYTIQPPYSFIHRRMIHAVFFIIGPLLFFYSKALTQYNFKLCLKDSFHLIPFILSAIVILSLGEVPRSRGFTVFVDATLEMLVAIQMLVYLVCMLYILKRYTQSIQNTYSSLEKINLHWLRFFVIGQAIVWPVAFILDVLWHNTLGVGFVWLPVSIFIYLIGYFGLLQPEIFSGSLKEEKILPQNGKKKYEKSALSPEQAETILQRLYTFMETSKPYINPTLTLPALSKQMNVSPNHLSQVINERLYKNFFEFINNYRVEEAKLLLKDFKKQHLTLAAIGFEAGFNSVSSFNSIFKKATSSTPSQYRLPDNPV